LNSLTEVISTHQKIIQEKIEKYENLINDIKTRGWNVDPILILIAGSTHKKSITEIKRIYL
jgi:hypothetical protein